MAISISIKKFKGREYVYIVEGFRDPITKRPTSRILASFGSKDKLLAADPDAMSKVEQKLKELQTSSQAYSNTIEQRLSSGLSVSDTECKRPPCLTCTPAVFHPIWEKLGMTGYFRNFRHNYDLDYDLDKTVFFSCISRLVKPNSKLSCWRHRQSFITDFSDIELQKKGMRFIVGYPPYIKLSAKQQKEFLQEHDWHWHTSSDNDRWGYKAMALNIDKKVKNSATQQMQQVKLSTTCIGTFSQYRFNQDFRELNLKWDRAANLVQTGKGAVAAANRSGYKAFVKVDTSQAQLNTPLYEKRKKWCGYGALLTNIENPDPEWVYKKLRQLWRIEDNFRMLKTNLQARPVFVWTDKHIRGHFVLNFIALVMQKILLKMLRDKGIELSAAEVIEALESMKISRLKGLKKANHNLYSCSNIDAQASSAMNKEGEHKSLKELCDEILQACGAEPLNSLETASTIRRKLKLKLLMQ